MHEADKLTPLHRNMLPSQVLQQPFVFIDSKQPITEFMQETFSAHAFLEITGTKHALAMY
jgi:hypothetical protein